MTFKINVLQRESGLRSFFFTSRRGTYRLGASTRRPSSCRRALTAGRMAATRPRYRAKACRLAVDERTASGLGLAEGQTSN